MRALELEAEREGDRYEDRQEDIANTVNIDFVDAEEADAHFLPAGFELSDTRNYVQQAFHFFGQPIAHAAYEIVRYLDEKNA